ncbi:zinc finger CCCH-type antiviral protein 1-like [Phyllobates terribilis]|uniref:zinc finger CCCH-type antiviral protein 1-like n=1 Tax=Phyllobates terribilis TaxID=111132 RepID=UPI003CCB58DD
MSDPTITAFLTKLLCSHGGRLLKDQLSGFLNLPPEQIEQILKDKSQKFPVVGDLVLARNPVRICPKYLKKEQEEKCDKLHLCKEYLLGKCKRPHCKLHHDISSCYNQTVLKVNEISGLNIQEIKVLLLQNDKQLQPEMPQVSIRNFQMLCDLKHNENLKLFHEAVKMESSTAMSDGREDRKRRNSEDAPRRKLPRVQEESAGMPAGLMSSTISAIQEEPITTPLTTARPVNASPVNVPMIGPSVSQSKPVPLQLVDLPNVQPIALTSPSKLVDSLSSSVLLETQMTISSPLVSQPFATIIKSNTPPPTGPFIAPSSSYIRLPNSPTKGSAVPLKTAVTTPITRPSSPQPVGLSSSIPHIFISKPTIAPMTISGTVITQPDKATVNDPSVSQAKSVPFPVPVLKVPEMASTRPCRLIGSLPKGPSVQIEKPISTSTTSPSNSQSTVNFMKSSICPKARISRVPSSSSYTTLVNSLTKSLSCPLDKPTITSIASPSNPQPAGLSSSITSLSLFPPKPTTPPVTVTGPANAPLNGQSVSQAKPVPFPVPVVNLSNVSPMLYTRRRRLVDSLYTGPSVPLKKPVPISSTSPSIRQSVFTFMKSSTPPATRPSTAPSSWIRFKNSPTKGPSVPLENPVQANVQSQMPVSPVDLVPVWSPTKPKRVQEICLSSLWKYCNLGRRCRDMHYYLPYCWQIFQGTTWEDVPNMEEIEKSYCDPKIDSVPLIDFLTMKSGGHRVRRLSTVSSVVKPSEYVLTTEWLWYWRDEYGTWTPYGHSNVNHMSVTISSSDLENLYLANANDVIPFSTGENNYEISFRDMKQKNVVYKTEKDVRRRPKFLSFDDVKLLKGSTRSEAAKSLLKLRKPHKKLKKTRLRLEMSPVKLEMSSLNIDIYPKTWDPEAMPELGCKKVLVSDTSSEFSEIVSSFSKTVSGHEVKRMWRIQNKSLWQMFHWQKEHMKKVNQGQDVKEIQLFHGTDSKHIDDICDQNFDWRICGTHGIVYGQGSYFARDASYSHNYSMPTSSGSRAMFVARVLVGDYIMGNPQMKRPPLRPGSSTRYYDSCVDDTTDPSIFVVFEKHQIYPEYLLEYDEEKKC